MMSERRATRLVIFDCDGVLVDSERIAVHIDQSVLETVGMSMSIEEIIDRFVGRTAAVIYEAIEKHLGRPLSADLRARFNRMYDEAFEAELEPVDGIDEALAQITQTICVASSSVPASLRHKLALTGLLEHFEGRMYSAEQVRRGKPAPDLFMFAADQMGVDPAECVVVEDSRYGVEAALAANMRVLGYTGGVTAASLGATGAVLFDDMRDLPDLVGG